MPRSNALGNVLEGVSEDLCGLQDLCWNRQEERKRDCRGGSAWSVYCRDSAVRVGRLIQVCGYKGRYWLEQIPL